MPRIAVERRAADLLELYKVEAPPVPVDMLAQRLGAKVAEEPLEDDVSGMLYRRGDRTLILVNRDHHPHRRRFSLAHELGHLVLHSTSDAAAFIDKKVQVNFRDSKSALGEDHREVEANRFAAALLMPKHWVLDQVRILRDRRRPPVDDDLISELADVFDVSPKAVEYRLANLGVLGTF